MEGVEGPYLLLCVGTAGEYSVLMVHLSLHYVNNVGNPLCSSIIILSLSLVPEPRYSYQDEKLQILSSSSNKSFKRNSRPSQCDFVIFKCLEDVVPTHLLKLT